MLTSLRLTNFKNFQDTHLSLGPLTLLVGTNASGKSNLRDAFRFLHGISRGYTLAEIMGEKWVDGGVLQWRGIRGGTREATYLQAETFVLEVTWEVTVADTEDANAAINKYCYCIEVAPNLKYKPPLLVRENLYENGIMVFETPDSRVTGLFGQAIKVAYVPDSSSLDQSLKPDEMYFHNNQPVLSQFAARIALGERFAPKLERAVHQTVVVLGPMRFLDLSPDAMRRSSLPGQTVLGDRGENLSSVLQAICQTEEGNKTLLSWLQELTPMDAVDFDFVPDLQGGVTLIIREKNGQRTSAYSASDGTLRFLAMAAALLGEEAAGFYFFEEMDNGIHPTRLALLLQLIEQRVADGSVQVVATTHSPPLLRLLSPKSLEHASLVYRSAEIPEARIIRLLDLPEARRVVREQDVARLLESGWLEDAVAFRDAQTQEPEKQAA